jgi:hypothetical protein
MGIQNKVKKVRREREVNVHETHDVERDIERQQAIITRFGPDSYEGQRAQREIIRLRRRLRQFAY